MVITIVPPVGPPVPVIVGRALQVSIITDRGLDYGKDIDTDGGTDMWNRLWYR